MSALFGTLVEEFRTWAAPEILAVALALGYLLLAIRENIWCWACAALSTAIYVWLFATAKLYMESILNLFYFAMAVYGWFSWRTGKQRSNQRAVVEWPLGTHARAISVILLSSLISGYVLASNTSAAYPYVDSATTFAAIWATFLVAKKVLENWWYWLIIDAVSIYLYWSRELELTALLFIIYVMLIPFGLLHWSRTLREQRLAVIK
jgi:nicotinamide mononucleotide transporter